MPHDMWIPPRPELEPVPPAVEVQSLNHWTTREVPRIVFLMKKKRNSVWMCEVSDVCSTSRRSANFQFQGSTVYFIQHFILRGRVNQASTLP